MMFLCLSQELSPGQSLTMTLHRISSLSASWVGSLGLLVLQ